MIVDEGRDVVLTCAARGDPTPVIRWIREDGKRFIVNSLPGGCEGEGKKGLGTSKGRGEGGRGKKKRWEERICKGTREGGVSGRG